MFRPRGLDTKAEHRAFAATLRGNHETRCVARLLTVDREPVGAVDLLDGQVDLVERDTPGDLYRTSAAVIRDPDNYLRRTAMNLMLRVEYQVAVPDLYEVSAGVLLPRWVGTRVFTGVFSRPPIRNGDNTVSLECGDRSLILMRPVPKRRYHKGKNTVGAIRAIAADCGETRFDLPQNNEETLDDAVVVSGEDGQLPWQRIQQLAATLDMQAFYDASGTLVVRRYPDDSPVCDMSGMMNPGTVEPPTQITNRWVVLGKKVGEGKHKHRLRAVEQLSRDNGYSPKALAVNDVPQWENPVTEDNAHLKTQAQVNQRAERLRKRGQAALRENRTWVGVPDPRWEPMDTVLVDPDTHTIRRFSIPFGPGEATLGYDEARF